MNAISERINQDVRKIEELSRQTSGRIKMKSVNGSPANTIVIELDYPTAPSQEYPAKVQKKTEIRIELLSRYPFQEPVATITTPILHPNVFSSGRICLGTKWLPTEGLDLLIKRIVRIITFDETILNGESPANRVALDWYRVAVRNNPGAFPTEKLVLKEPVSKKIEWNTLSKEGAEKVIVKCPTCSCSLNVPAGKKGNIACPKCSHKFYFES